MIATATVINSSLPIYLFAGFFISALVVMWLAQRSRYVSSGELWLIWGVLIVTSFALRRLAPRIGAIVGAAGFPLLMLGIGGLALRRRAQWLMFADERDLCPKGPREWVGTLEGVEVHLHPLSTRGSMGLTEKTVGMTFSVPGSALSLRRRQRPQADRKGVHRYFEVTGGDQQWLESHPDAFLELVKITAFTSIKDGSITLKVGPYDGPKALATARQAHRLVALLSQP